MIKLIIFSALLPIVFAGCTSTNPELAFDDVNKTVTARTGQTVQWSRHNSASNDVANAIEPLLKTNLTAQAAVTIALLNNRSLQAEFDEIGISQADLAQASRLRNIEIVGSWRFPDRPPSLVDAEYSAAVNFLDLLTLPMRKKNAALNLEQIKLRVADSVLQLASETQTAFYTLQAGEALVKRLSVSVAINAATADLAQRQYDAGNINELELQNQQAAFTQAQLDFMQAQAQTRVKREHLNRLLGLSGAQVNWKVDDDLPMLPEQEPVLANLEMLAVNQRLDLAAARSQAESVAAVLRLKKKTRFIPGITVGVDTERNTDGQRVTGPSLGLELPLFDQGQPALARLAAQYRQVQNNYAALEVNIRSEVRQMQGALLAARTTAEHYRKTLLPQRQKILHQTLLQYNAMQKNSYDLLAAKEREQIAERGYIEALRDYWIARAELERAVGGRLSRETSPLPAVAEPMKMNSTTPTEQPHNH